MEKKLLLQELADLLAMRENITKKKADAFTKCFFEVIERGLESDKFVKIKGFGTFKVISVSDRESVNVNTGERIQISGHSKITFTPDAELRDLINRPFAHFETVVLNEATDLSELEAVNYMDESENEAGLQETPGAHDNDADGVESAAAPPADIAMPHIAESTLGAGESTLGVDKSTLGADESTLGADEPESGETVVNLGLPPVVPPEDSVASSADMETGEDAETPQHQEVPPEPEEATDGTRPEPASADAEEPETDGKESEVPPENPEAGGAGFAGDGTEANAMAAVGEETGETPAATESDTEENGFFTAVTPSEQTVSEDGNPPAGEQEDDPVQVAAPQPPVIVPTPPSHTSGNLSWGKAIAVFAVVFLLMVLSYFAGYFRLFCPCEFMGGQQNILTSTKDSIQTKKTTVVKADTVLPSVKDTVPKAKPDTTAVAPAVKRETKQPERVSTPPRPASEKKNTPTRIDSNRVKQKPRPAPEKAPGQAYQQVPGGKYKIVGTFHRYTVTKGETVRSIAEFVYGSKGYAPYIIAYNNLTNPNHIAVGSVLLLPKLEKAE